MLDEASMLKPQFLDLCDRIAKHVRKNDKPLGGIRAIFCGDFFQLEPVQDRNVKIKFAFQSPVWGSLFGGNIYELEHVIRQTELEFISVLNKIRKSVFDFEVEQFLRSRSSAEPDNDRDRFEAVVLVGTNNAAKWYNEQRMKVIGGEGFRYISHDSGIGRNLKKNLDSTSSKSMVDLKETCLVIACANLAPGVVNGSQGKVVGFELADKPRGKFQIEFWKKQNHKKVPVVLFTHAKVQVVCNPQSFKKKRPGSEDVLCRYMIPLLPGVALTVHKAQGMTLRRIIVDVKHFFLPAQLYVSLSRVRRSEDVFIKNLDMHRIQKMCFQPNKEVVEYMDKAITFASDHTQPKMGTKPKKRKLKNDVTFGEMKKQEKEVIVISDSDSDEEDIFPPRSD